MIMLNISFVIIQIFLNTCNGLIYADILINNKFNYSFTINKHFETIIRILQAHVWETINRANDVPLSAQKSQITVQLADATCCDNIDLKTWFLFDVQQLELTIQLEYPLQLTKWERVCSKYSEQWTKESQFHENTTNKFIYL